MGKLIPTETSTEHNVASTTETTTLNTLTSTTTTSIEATSAITVNTITTTTTLTGTTTASTLSTRLVISQVQGNLILSAPYSMIFAGDAPSAGTKAALTASIAEIAGVDISVVVVRLGLPRRLQSDSAEFSIAY